MSFSINIIMGVDIQIANKIDNNVILQNLTKNELTNKQPEENTLSKKINKQEDYISAPEYLFDEKSRKLFYSILFPKKEKSNNKNDINNEEIKDIKRIHKKSSFDLDMFDKRRYLDDNQTNDCEFQLNYYKKEKDLRKSYMNKLINKGIWVPNNEKKKYNSIIIFDWDDTLLPTTFLVSKGIFEQDIEYTKYEKQKLIELEDLILQLLTLAVNKGDVYIITNSDKGWVEYSSRIFYPSLSTILKKIKIISAKSKFQDKFPDDSRLWKINTFINLTNDINVRKVTNIICSGDSIFEIEAANILASKFNEAFIKTIKFKEKPDLTEVYKQLKLVFMQFNIIHSAVKNLTIRVEKKKSKSCFLEK